MHYIVKQVYPWLYSILEPGEPDVFFYLVLGAKEALLYDTGYGVGQLKTAIRGITDLPVTVVLGHGHLDHANGAYQFDEAWIHGGDLELCRQHSSEGFRKDIANTLQNPPEGFVRDEYLKAGTGKLRNLEAGRVFDLGGLQLEVIAMEGHTAGSVGLLAKEHKVLLTSDASNPHIWMFLEESLPVSTYIAMLERTYRLDFDTFFLGHTDEPQPKSDFLRYINVARNASIEKARPYETIFTGSKGYIYGEDGIEIIFKK